MPTMPIDQVYDRLDQLAVIWHNLSTGGNIDQNILSNVEESLNFLSKFVLDQVKEGHV